jgi:hypothetical protein
LTVNVLRCLINEEWLTALKGFYHEMVVEKAME